MCATSTLNLLCNIKLESASLQAMVSRGWAANKVPSCLHTPSLTTRSHTSIVSDKIRVFAAKCQVVFLSEKSQSSWQEPGSPSLSTQSTLCFAKKQPACPDPKSLPPSLGLGQLGSVASMFWVESLGKQGTHLPLGMFSLTSAALVLPLPNSTEALGNNKIDTPQA